MNDFLITPSECRRMYKVVNDCEIGSLLVTAGYEFDGASVPRFFWRIVPPGRPWVLRASCAHDYMYDFGIASKKAADDLFYNILKEDMTKAGVSPRLMKMMYWSVRKFGKGNY